MADETVPAPEPAPTPKKPRKPRDPGAAKLAALKKKYRLDDEVELYSVGKDHLPLGMGPLLSPQVFQKFAELDTTKEKKYLDWMLFMAGGGEKAFDHSKRLWGDGSPEMTGQDIANLFNKFDAERPTQTVHGDELRLIAKKLSDKQRFKNLFDSRKLLDAFDEVAKATSYPSQGKRFQALVKVLQDHQIAPGSEERLAMEIISNKFKAWIRNHLPAKTRDRVHASSVYSRVVRGIPFNEAEEQWKKTEPKRRREWLFGDQDSLSWDGFGFTRNWPGRNNVYEQVYDQMRTFLANKEKLERYNERLASYNARIASKNTADPNAPQSPMHDAMKFNLDIGSVILKKNGDLDYKGEYPTVHALGQLNAEIETLPMRERVSRDIRYSGPKGTSSRSAKLYSDQNLDVMVPLTVAAAIQSGHADWPVSSPKQLADLKSDKLPKSSESPWTKYASGRHDFPEWNTTQAIPVFFHIKVPGTPPAAQRLMAIVFLDDLVDLQPPYSAIKWRIIGNNKIVKFQDVISYLRDYLATVENGRQLYLQVVRSFTNAMKTLREWGKEFNPQDVVADYLAHHRERIQTKRSIGESIHARASQVIEALIS